jgi:hypothetical protein
MNVSFRRVSIAVAIALAAVGVGLAQAADTAATKGPARACRARWSDRQLLRVLGWRLRGRCAARLSFAGHFRYQIDRTWGWQFSPEFTWNGYVSHAQAPYLDAHFPGENLSKQHYITQFAGLGAQLQYFGARAAVGTSVPAPRSTASWCRAIGKVVNDPVSKEDLKTRIWAPRPSSASSGCLKRLPNTALEATSIARMAHGVRQRQDEVPERLERRVRCSSSCVWARTSTMTSSSPKPAAGRARSRPVNGGAVGAARRGPSLGRGVRG